MTGVALGLLAFEPSADAVVWNEPGQRPG